LAAFDAMNRQREEAGEPPFAKSAATPRPAPSGCSNPRQAAARPPICSIWGFGAPRGEPMPPAHSEGLERLRVLGLRVNPETRRCRDLGG